MNDVQVTHVTAGHRWFTHLCALQGVDPVPTFREEVRRGWRGDIKGPFNAEDRERAGLVPEFYEGLKGAMDDGLPKGGSAEKSAAAEIAYEADSLKHK